MVIKTMDLKSKSSLSVLIIPKKSQHTTFEQLTIHKRDTSTRTNTSSNTAYT